MPKKQIPVISFILGCAGLAYVMVSDAIYSPIGIGFFDFDFPVLNGAGIVRSSLIFLSTLAIISSFTIISKPVFTFSTNNRLHLLRFFLPVCLSISFASIFVFDTPFFDLLGAEDGVVEWISALLLFVTSFIFGSQVIRSLRDNDSWIVPFTFIIFSLVCLVMGMEEISWFQRVLEYDTPDILSANQQHEANLHNIYDDQCDLTYYISAGVIFTLLPFLKGFILSVVKPRHKPYLARFLPSPIILINGVIAVSINYDRWNNSLIQAIFFAAIIVTVFYLINTRQRNEKIILIITLSLAITMQAILLLSDTPLLNIWDPDGYYEIWDPNEYKELLIILTLLWYSLGFVKNKKL